MSLEIESINEPILLPGVKKPRAKRRTFKNQEERNVGFQEYRRNYYQENIKGKIDNKSLLSYYKKRYELPMALICKLDEISRDTLNNYCNAKSALDLLFKDNNHVFKDLLELYISKQYPINPTSSLAEPHKD